MFIKEFIMDNNDINAHHEKALTAAGPAVELRISGAGNPNRVRKGNSLEKLPSASLFDANGAMVPDTGKYTLVSVVPPTPGVSVMNTAGPMNGKVFVSNVQNSMTITARCTPTNHPHLAKNYVVQVMLVN
jgi:hypothetical protein